MEVTAPVLKKLSEVYNVSYLDLLGLAGYITKGDIKDMEEWIKKAKSLKDGPNDGHRT